MKKWKVKFWPTRQSVTEKSQIKEIILRGDRISKIRSQLEVHFPQCQINSVVETA